MYLKHIVGYSHDAAQSIFHPDCQFVINMTGDERGAKSKTDRI